MEDWCTHNVAQQVWMILHLFVHKLFWKFTTYIPEIEMYIQNILPVMICVNFMKCLLYHFRRDCRKKEISYVLYLNVPQLNFLNLQIGFLSGSLHFIDTINLRDLALGFVHMQHLQLHCSCICDTLCWNHHHHQFSVILFTLCIVTSTIT